MIRLTIVDAEDVKISFVIISHDVRKANSGREAVENLNHVKVLTKHYTTARLKSCSLKRKG